jgi:hypothetical protein
MNPSSERAAQTRHSGTIAMSRSFDGLPSRVTVLDDDGDVVGVTATDENQRICFPKAEVFEYSESLFERLHAAFHAGQDKELTRLWQSAHSLQ